jgi:hypothetical protein
MIQFEDLPRTNRTLLLTTLVLELNEANCTNILQLAHKRNLPVAEIWREICRRTGQPRCTVPAQVTLPREQWPDAASAGHAAPMTAAPAAPMTPAPEAPPPAAAQVDGGANADPIAALAPATPAASVKPPRAKAAQARRAGNPRGALAAGLALGLAAGLALGVTFFVLAASPRTGVAPQATLQFPNGKPGDARSVTIIRERSAESAPPPFDPSSLPPPQGTMRRLEGISKSFLNR